MGAGADGNVLTLDGWTALHEAVAARNTCGGDCLARHRRRSGGDGPGWSNAVGLDRRGFPAEGSRRPSAAERGSVPIARERLLAGPSEDKEREGNAEDRESSERAMGSSVGQMIRDTWRDAAQALRILKSSPGVTLVAVVSIGLAIGMATGIFSQIQSMMLAPVPGIRAPSELVSSSIPMWSPRCWSMTQTH